LVVNRTARDTATILAAMLKRSGQTRARISATAVKLISKRNLLRAAFILALADEMEDLAWIFFELRGGGFGAIQTKALEAAKPVTPMRWLDDAERKALRLGTLDVATLAKEAAPEDDEQPLEAD
jgi:hypothetical protein